MLGPALKALTESGRESGSTKRQHSGFDTSALVSYAGGQRGSQPPSWAARASPCWSEADRQAPPEPPPIPAAFGTYPHSRIGPFSMRSFGPPSGPGNVHRCLRQSRRSACQTTSSGRGVRRRSQEPSLESRANWHSVGALWTNMPWDTLGDSMGTGQRRARSTWANASPSPRDFRTECSSINDRRSAHHPGCGKAQPRFVDSMAIGTLSPLTSTSVRSGNTGSAAERSLWRWTSW